MDKMESKAQAIKRHFNICAETRKSTCKIDSCGKVLSGKNASNLSRHLIRCHPNVAIQLKLIENNSDQENTAPIQKKKRLSTVKIEIDENSVIRSCVKLVTIHSLPLAVIGYEGFREILNPIEKALNIKINSNNIHDHIKSTSKKFVDHIKNEIKSKMISLKMDGATRLDRNVLGVNIQFIKAGKIIVRTIGMIQMTERMTSENLKEAILSILQKFQINISQLYSVTTDNGANMIKTVKILADYQHQSITPAELIDITENDDDVEEELITSAESNFYSTVDSQILGILSCVRCAAHTLQLVANSVLTQPEINEKINSIRKIIKNLKTVKYRSLFIINSAKRPTLDVGTRWGSTFLMVRNVYDNKQLYAQLAQSDPEVGYSDEQFQFMESFLESFKPIYEATIKLQSSQLVIGDFYKEWLLCKLTLGIHEHQMSIDLKQEMIIREQQLFASDIFNAAMFLDPRFNYLNSTNLSESDKINAKNHLKKLQNTIKGVGRAASISEIPVVQFPQSPEPTGQISMVENYLRTKDDQSAEGAHEAFDLETKLNMLCFNKRLHSDENILEYWETMKYQYPELYQLAEIALAVPATQVSVERSFSALALILTSHRNRLSGDLLEDILLIKLNRSLFENVI